MIYAQGRKGCESSERAGSLRVSIMTSGASNPRSTFSFNMFTHIDESFHRKEGQTIEFFKKHHTATFFLFVIHSFCFIEESCIQVMKLYFILLTRTETSNKVKQNNKQMY